MFLLVITTAIECFSTACVTPINYLWGQQSNKIKYLFQCLEIMFLAGNITIYPFLFMNSKIMIEYKIRICHWYTTLESSFFNIYVSDKNSFFLNKMAFLFYGLLFRFSTHLTEDSVWTKPFGQKAWSSINILATSIIFWSKIPAFLNLHFKWSALFLRSFSYQNYGRRLRRRKRWKTHQKL